MNVLSNFPRMILIWAIRAYRALISPALPRSCKYHPSCSQYALEAVTRYGAARGFVLAAWRLMRCNPLSYGGYDPVDAQRLFRPRPRPVGPEAAARGELGCTEVKLQNMKHGEAHSAGGHFSFLCRVATGERYRPSGMVER